MTKHTPGPWFCENGDDEWQVWHDEGIACIATVHRGCEPDGTGETNAHLIAAAPDLLAALEELLPELQCRCHLAFTSRGKHDPKTLCHHADAVKSAIAKARGQG